MGEVSGRNFGVVIAYLVPGFIIVLASSLFSSVVRGWMTADAGSQPTVGGFLFITLASVAAGMIAGAVRWVVVDSILHTTGVSRASLDFSRLQSRLTAYTLVVEHYFRFYQFYANTAVAIAFAYVSHVVAACGWCGGLGWLDIGFLTVEGVLLAASRDSLRRYYLRASQVLGAAEASLKEKSHDKRRRTTRRMGRKQSETSGRETVGDETERGAGAERWREDADGGESGNEGG